MLAEVIDIDGTEKIKNYRASFGNKEYWFYDGSKGYRLDDGKIHIGYVPSKKGEEVKGCYIK